MILFKNKFLKYLLDKDYEKLNYKKRTIQKYNDYKKTCIDISCNISWTDYINDIIDISFSDLN
jgi:hypothetical protein